MTDVVEIHRGSTAWTFILNRPEKRNALSSELVEALIDGLVEASKAGVSQLIFRGNGKNFSAGFDFTGYQNQSEGDLVLRFIRIETLLQTIANWPGSTMAFAHGRNFGAGVDLFAACKHRYCTVETAFRMPGVMFGLVLGTRRFQTLVGLSHAHSILASARMFDANEALRIGFVEDLYAEEEWANIINQLDESANRLDEETRKSLYDILCHKNQDADMSALVRSAARPGLKLRIARYLGDAE